ncbi:MAG: hypothetical protein M3436_16230 [Pseudomonadota bacterium]|nr:hypothetical protein [Pseudomonadota bacterium]
MLLLLHGFGVEPSGFLTAFPRDDDFVSQIQRQVISPFIGTAGRQFSTRAFDHDAAIELR